MNDTDITDTTQQLAQAHQDIQRLNHAGISLSVRLSPYSGITVHAIFPGHDAWATYYPDKSSAWPNGPVVTQLSVVMADVLADPRVVARLGQVEA